MMRRSTVYLRKGQFLIHASSKTTAGVWILSEPCLIVAETGDDQALGLAIRAALDGSRVDVPHPQSWGGLLAPLLKLANVKSWSTFSKNAACASIAEDDEGVSLVPKKNLGVDEGFEDIPSRQIVLGRQVSSGHLGASARRVLVDSR